MFCCHLDQSEASWRDLPINNLVNVLWDLIPYFYRMKPIGLHNYFVYILTNKDKSVLYIGVTNNLSSRLYQHRNSENKKSFTYRFNAYFLIYYEHFREIEYAIAREKQLKKWSRLKKENLINSTNPDWDFLDVDSL